MPFPDGIAVKTIEVTYLLEKLQGRSVEWDLQFTSTRVADSYLKPKLQSHHCLRCSYIYTEV